MVKPEKDKHRDAGDEKPAEKRANPLARSGHGGMVPRYAIRLIQIAISPIREFTGLELENNGN